MAVILQQFAQIRPDEHAIVDDVSAVTWSELNARVNQLVHALRRAGIHEGDRVAVLAGNRHELFETALASWHGGWVIVPLNWHFTADEIAYVLNDSAATALIGDATFLRVAEQAAAAASTLRLRTVFGGPAPAGFDDYEALLAAEKDDEPDPQPAGSSMIYTSGTTGRPKGVINAPVNGKPATAFKSLLEGLALLLEYPENGRALISAPCYHAGPFYFGASAMALGNQLVLRTTFDPEAMLNDIQTDQITMTYAVPTHFERLLRLPSESRNRYDLSSLQFVLHTAAPCPPTTKKAMIDWWGPVIYEGYGASEGGVVTFVNSNDYLTRPGTVGKPLPIFDLVVVDDSGHPVPQGATGEIYIRSKIGGDFEYHGAPDKTAEAHLAPGLFTFGDIGHVDAEGYLYLSDRKIDMIISGGVNIYPAEIEAVLINHPAVHEVAVIGIPNDEFGEEVKAIVQLCPDLKLDDDLEADLKDWCRDHLASYKVPRTIDAEDSLPRTETGKLLKRQLREPFWSEAGRTI